MTKREVKKHLESHFYASKKITALEIEIKGLKASGKADAVQKLSDEISRLQSTMNEVRQTIALLDDADLESVLIMRYINHRTIEQAAEDLNYATRTICVKTERGIEKLCTKMH